MSTPIERAAEALPPFPGPSDMEVARAALTAALDVDELARVIDQAADDWDLGIDNGGQTWEHALARAVVAHLTKGNENNE